jgi:glutaredoxin
MADKASSTGVNPPSHLAKSKQVNYRDDPIASAKHPYSSMQITLYSAFWCPDCRVARRFLAKHNLPYTEIDIETTPGAADEVIRRTGKRAIPQLVVDGEWIQPYRPGEGFLYQEMSERLGLIG